MYHVLMINFLMIMEKAVSTWRSISLKDQKIKSNNCHFLCVGRLINILVLFLLQHLNWIERYSTMKIGRFFFVWVYIKIRLGQTNTRGIFTMTRSPGEKTAIQNKQAIARLPHSEYNIDCNLSNLRKHFIMTVSLLCSCIHRSRVQSRNPVHI